MTSAGPNRMRAWWTSPASAFGPKGCRGHIPFAANFFRYADWSAEPTLNHDALAKLTVTIIVLVALLVWRVADQKKSIECGANCPTDLSASRKAAQ
ncbi:hypothetical protein [Bradyrhizobium sp. USDA 3458]|uniref:hypothetical protein n=1 Tax=Bradyrhizobium sp. USDA 3458 TaxID=2591461 RepID=UPI001142B8F8|nr:hypothetical protein [Bradyrhizobium sp. USDA 3458]